MSKKTYKVQFDIDYKDKEPVEMLVRDAGFASIPAAMKYAFSQIKKGNIGLSSNDKNSEPIYLTDEQVRSMQRTYEEFVEEEKKGNIFETDSLNDLMRKLDED